MKVLKSLSIAALAVLLAGCPDNEPHTIWVQGVLAPDDSCVWQPLLGSGVAMIAVGYVDLSVNRDGYFAGIQIINNIPNSEAVTELGPNKFHLENGAVQLVGATVNYDTEGLSVSLPSGFFQYTPSGIFPREVGVGVVNLVPPAVLQILRTEPWLVGDKEVQDPLVAACLESVSGEATWRNVPLGGREVTILARVVFEGILQDGTEVRSNEFRFPIKICNGCLLSLDAHACGVLSLSGAQTCPSPPCNAGQDDCTESALCFSQHFLVEQDMQSRLVQCASNPNFPPANVPTASPANCGEFIGPEYTAGDVTYLLYRYAFERVNAYCRLRAESPLWPPQP